MLLHEPPLANRREIISMMGQLNSQTVGAALVVSRDSIASAQISDVFREHALSVEVSYDPSAAMDRLSRHKYEAVVVDSTFASRALVCLKHLRASASNRTAVAFALTSGKEATARALTEGFGFVLERPLTPDAISHTLRVAYGMIVRERRRYYRHPVVVPTVFSRKDASEVFGRTINISERGMALRALTLLEPETEGVAQFTLPGLEGEIRAQSRVCWSKPSGEAGLSFLFLPANRAADLQAWLMQRLEEQLPESVVERFRQPMVAHMAGTGQ
jgi:hypothetical protein